MNEKKPNLAIFQRFFALLPANPLFIYATTINQCETLMSEKVQNFERFFFQKSGVSRVSKSAKKIIFLNFYLSYQFSSYSQNYYYAEVQI